MKGLLKNNKWLVAIIVMTIVVLVLTFGGINIALALTDTGKSAAIKAGNGAELWNSATNSFNGTVLNDLKQKLFNKQNPLTYIENKYDREEYELTGSKIVTAKTINAQVGKPEEGMIVKLGGQDWMVTSLTTTNDGKDDVVLTLYLANPDTTEKVQYWKEYSTESTNPNYKYGKKGENMYGSSILREHLLTSAKWSMFSRGYFANNFLVQPTKIQYQHTQSAVGRWSDGYNWYWSNDALDTFTEANGGQWHEYLYYGGQTPYKATDVHNDNSGNPQRYDAWGEDYIWIPSMTEVGGNNDYMKERSVWKISPTQKQFWDGTSTDVNNRTWLRSGDSGNYSYAYVLCASGVHHDATVTYSLGVRPALHLNLTSAVLSTAGDTGSTAPVNDSIMPKAESGYDFAYIDEEGIRQGYAKNGYIHGVKAPTNVTTNVLGNIQPNTTISAFVNSLKNDKTKIKIYKKNGAPVYDGAASGSTPSTTQYIGTGYRIDLYNGSTKVDTAQISVLGDIDGNGMINAIDITMINKIAIGETKLSDLDLEFKLASLIDNKGIVTVVDSCILTECMFGTININRYF